MRFVDIAGATALASVALSTSKFLDIKQVMVNNGIPFDLIPAELEGMAFGQDVVIGGHTKHMPTWPMTTTS